MAHDHGDRLSRRFADLTAQGRSAFVTFTMAGDPDTATSLEILQALPGAGADVVELGMPFSDPMADGPSIQQAGQRAIRAGQTMIKTLSLVRAFRQQDQTTPLVLMGYFNPIYRMGVARFLQEATEAGVDGLIVVDTPPEADGELCLPAQEAGLHFIRLATPTTDDQRLPAVLENSSGFLYYVAVAGVTGGKAAAADVVGPAVTRLKRHTDLPIAVGFGIRQADQARAIAELADGVVVGSALVEQIAASLDGDGQPDSGLVERVSGYVASLAEAVHGAPTG